MRVVEAVVSIPGIMVAIVIIAILGPGLHRAMIALGILFSTSFLRLARGVVLAEREEVYVRSARIVGASDSRILLRHIFPNIAPPLIVQITLTVGAVLLAEAGPQLHRPRRPAATGELGHDAQHRRGLHGPELVPGDPAGRGDHRRGAVGQPDRRRAARFDRSRDHGRVEAGPARRALRLDRRRRPTARCRRRARTTTCCGSKACRSTVPSRHGDPVPVITDLSLQHQQGRDAGAGRRIGQRQDPDRPGHPGPDRRRPSAPRTARSWSTAATCGRCRQAEIERVRGNEVAMVFQDPTTSLNPAFTGRQPDRRSAARQAGPDPESRPGAARSN